MTGDRLLLRSTLSFAALPGIVAYLVPLVLLRPGGAPPRSAGLAIAAAGTAVLLTCVRDFHVRGRGTLAPWDPPQRLVRTGLYRYSRNPMYVGVLIVVSGWALAWPAATLWVYAGTIAALFHLRILLGEEPWLAATFGDEWTVYKRSVPRWVGRSRAGDVNP
jgi:protein-S-isoprenylcysteine O-methyltransferase Ste14